jgi:predicted DNA-binding transcriptional regulator YafY
MNRIDRLFNILTLLQSKKYVTAEKIAEKFSLSIRTVYRDIKALVESGIPISFEPQRGYFIVQGYFLPPVAFSKEEANAFLLMEALVSGFSDKSIQKHFSNGLNKIKAVMRPSEKEKIEALSKNIKLKIPSCFQFGFEYLSVLQNAIGAKTAVELEYKNNRQEISRRVIEPIGLVFYALHWHLVAWCCLRQEYRDFKVARILRLKNIASPFTKADHIELGDYMKNIPVDY